MVEDNPRTLGWTSAICSSTVLFGLRLVRLILILVIFSPKDYFYPVETFLGICSISEHSYTFLDWSPTLLVNSTSSLSSSPKPLASVLSSVG